jgi:hypothetical protein
MIYWLLITNAIVAYAHKKNYNYEPISLENILKYIYDEVEYSGVVSDIIKYIESRKEFYSKTTDFYKLTLNTALFDNPVSTKSIREALETIKISTIFLESGEYELNNDTINAFIEDLSAI